MPIVLGIGTVIISYLLGSFSSAYFLGKTSKNIDIRQFGSGNAGATNALRVMGKKLGVLTFFLDFLKGVLAVIIGRLIFGNDGGLLASIFVVIGHNYPVFLGFKGGKGIATSFGVLLMLNWKLGLLCAVVALLIIAITKIVSLGSMGASIIAPFTVVLITKPLDKKLFITVCILAIMSIYRHKANIIRLYKGEENKLTKKI